MSKVTTTSVTARELCLQIDPKHYSEKEPSYEFTRKKFTKPQQTRVIKDD